MKAIGFCVALLIARGFAYTWSPLGPKGFVVYDWSPLSPGDYPGILCADSGAILHGDAGWEIFSSEGLPCVGACQAGSTEVLLALGRGHPADGLYLFDLEAHDFTLRHPCPHPRCINHSVEWNAYFAGHGAGISVSTNAVDWLIVDEFSDTGCDVVAMGDSSVVVALDTTIFYADRASALEFGDRIDLGLVEHGPIAEASGIVASRRNARVLWTHNDSGNPNAIYALSDGGVHLGAYTISGASNRDWEDMAIGYDGENDRYLLYVGDIGDNNGVHENKYLYVIEEPAVSVAQSPVTETLYGMQRITFQYPGGIRYNAETLLCDPLTNDLYIVTKQGGGVAQVFRAAYPQSTTETIILEHVADLSGLGGTAVGGSLSPSGREILIKTYSQMFHWRREQGQTVGDAFGSPRTTLPYVQEPQGEAVCWMANLMGYYTVSEEQGGTPAHLYLYRREAWRQASPSHLSLGDIAMSAGDTLVGVWPGDEAGAGLWISVDRGASWAQQLGAPGLRAVTVDSRNVVFTGWEGARDTTGVAVWSHETATLMPVNEGLPSASVNRLRIDATGPEERVVCCTDSGAAVLTGYFDAMNLRIGFMAPDTARLEWTQVPAATHYDIFRSPWAFSWGDELPWHTVAVPETMCLVTDGLGIPDTAFFFGGRARNASYITPRSNVVGAQTRGLP